MKIDKVTKVLLCVIAVCLLLITASIYLPPREAQAQTGMKVIAGYISGNLFYRIWDNGRMEYFILSPGLEDPQNPRAKNKWCAIQ